MRYFIVLFFIATSLFAEENSAVTYEFSGGRFGDCLLSYIHAKWVAYKLNAPLLYKKFHHSGQLVLHKKERPFKGNFPQVKAFSTGMSIYDFKELNTLYVIPYFSESSWERHREPGPYFEVDWNDQKFKKILKELIAPRNQLSLVKPPKDCVTVAIHFRSGKGFDSPEAYRLSPLKFPREQYYFDQLKVIYNMFNKQHLYVYVFTDDPDASLVLKRFKEKFSGYDIAFDCRKEKTGHANLVLEDFFSLLQFDCLIRTESNFSLVASKLTDYLVEISPVGFDENGINQANYVVKKL